MDQPVRFRRNDVFLEEQFQDVGRGLQESPRSDAVRPDAILDKRADAAFHIDEIGHRRQDDQQDDDDLDQRDDEKFHANVP